MALKIIEKAAMSITQSKKKHRETQAFQTAEKALHQEIKAAVQKTSKQFGIVRTDKTPKAFAKQQAGMIQEIPYAGTVANLHGISLYTSLVSGALAFTPLAPIAIPALIASSSTWAATGISSFFSAMSMGPTDGPTQEITSSYYRSLAKPIRYSVKAFRYGNLDPRSWRLNSNEIVDNVMGSKNYSSYYSDRKNLVEKYMREGMSENLLDVLHKKISDELDKFSPTKRHEQYGAAPELIQAVLIDSRTEPQAFLNHASVMAQRLPGFHGNTIGGTGTYQPLEATMPEIEEAEIALEDSIQKLLNEKAGLSAVTLFGSVASNKAEESRAAVKHWQIQQTQSLPPSLQLMERITEEASRLKSIVKEQGQPNKGGNPLTRLFSGEATKTDQMNLQTIAANIMNDSTALRSTIEDDLKRYECAMEDNERAQDILHAHADILARYRDEFNQVAPGLKKKVARQKLDGKNTRFSPSTIEQSKQTLEIQALRARQEAAAYEHVHQPLNEYLARNLPVLSRRSADILQAVEEIYRIARLQELADLSHSVGTSSELVDTQVGIADQDVRHFAKLGRQEQEIRQARALEKLEKVVSPWRAVVEEVRKISEIEDFSTARLMIPDMSGSDTSELTPTLPQIDYVTS